MDRQARYRRHVRLRRRIHGTAARPRVNVHRSSQHVFVQLIDDDTGRTLASSSSRMVKGDSKIARAEAVGQELAKAATAAGVSQIVFDRGGYLYHGRVKAIAEGLRAGGLTF